MARILVVDDAWLTRLQVEEILTHLGYEVAGGWLNQAGRLLKWHGILDLISFSWIL